MENAVSTRSPRLQSHIQAFTSIPARRLLAAILALLVSVGPIAAQTGLDPTFGVEGRASTDLPFFFDFAKSLTLVQPDGKILVIGSTGNYVSGGAIVNAALVRYNSNGSLDMSFGTGGTKLYTTASGFPSMVVNSGLVQPDGKIVIVAVDHGIRVLRVNADLNPDGTFGSGGLVTITGNNTHSAASQVSSVILQSDGKLVIATDNPTATLIRLNTDGSIDYSFGNSGTGTVVFTDLFHGSLIQQPDGKLLYAYIGDQNMSVARFSPDGLLDTSFGSGGAANVDFGKNEAAKALAMQPDGKIVVAGSTAYTFLADQARSFAMARLNGNGSVDTSFGVAGKLTVDLNERVVEEWQALAFEANGNIIAGGFPGMHVIRISPSGVFLGRSDRDNQFQDEATSGSVSGIVVQPDGRILLAGSDDILRLARFTDVTHVNDARMRFDFDGDGEDDISVYRPGGQSNYYGFFSGGSITGVGTSFFAQPFGVVEDIIVPADYTGDNITDFAVFRPTTGTWYNSVRPDINPAINFQGVQWGTNGDIPAPGDFDGDGIDDRAVFRPSTGIWYVLLSSGGYTAAQWGMNGDKPMPADYDGDGKADLAVVRDIGGSFVWYILQTSDGSFRSASWGVPGDKCISSDFDGDGRADITVFRSSVGAAWYTLSNYATYTARQWGQVGDLPVPADYDRDGIVDLAIFRPSNASFYIKESAIGSTTIVNLGLGTDQAIATAYIR